MIEKVMIQLGATNPTRGVGGGGAAAPPMMIEKPMMIQKVMIQLGAKNLKSSGGVGGGGGPTHDDRKSDDSSRGKNLSAAGGWGGGGCRRMTEKVTIQFGTKNLQSSGWLAPPIMIEKVMIQLGVHFNRKGGQEELAMLRMQDAVAKNQLRKQRMQKAKARTTKPKSHVIQRMRKAKAAKAA